MIPHTTFQVPDLSIKTEEDLQSSSNSQDRSDDMDELNFKTMPVPPYLGRPLPQPTLEQIAFKDAKYPNWSMEKFMLIKTQFGIIHDRANDADRHGIAMHWRADERPVNQGLAFYNAELKTFYLKSAKEPKLIMADGDYAKDTLRLGIERKWVDKRYNKIAFSIGPPFSDVGQMKIKPCDYHVREYQIGTYFSIMEADKSTPPTLCSSNKEDKWVFDITGRYEQFLHYRVKFWCATSCIRAKLTSKKDNLVFYVTLMGEGMKDIRIWTNVNSQQNPGRGAKVVQPAKPASFSRFNIDMPSYNWRSVDGRHVTVNPSLESNKNSALNNSLGISNNSVTFTNYGDKIRVDILLPKNFVGVLGSTQANAELESIQRDIAYLSHTKLRDAFKKKILANEELMRNNSMMMNANMSMKKALDETKSNLQIMCHENDRISSRLRDEMTARRNCDSCKITQMAENKVKTEEDDIVEVVEK